MLIDSHAHLDMPQFDRDRNEVIRRARDARIHCIFTVGTDVSSSRQAIRIAHENPAVYAIVGIHPHDVKDMDRNSLKEIREIAQDPRVKAYGEIGLDFFRSLSPRLVQIERFRQQIRLARDLDLPVVIHDRDAHSETMRVLAEEGDGDLRVVMHCFSGDLAMARRCLDKGFYLSIPGTVTFPKADRLREVVQHIPLDRMLVETDCPYLAPEPFRGKRNEPSYVRHTAEKIAAIKGVSLDLVARKTSDSALGFFRIRQEAP